MIYLGTVNALETTAYKILYQSLHHTNWFIFFSLYFLILREVERKRENDMGACATKPATKEGEAPLPAEEEAKVEAAENKEKEAVAAETETESGQQSLSTLLSREIEVGLVDTDI